MYHKVLTRSAFSARRKSQFIKQFAGVLHPNHLTQQRFFASCFDNGISYDDSGAHDTDYIRPKRLWVSSTLPLRDKVNMFLNATPGSLHKSNLYFETNKLFKDASNSKSKESMILAQDLLNRLLLEKRTRNNIIINIEPFEIMMHGWLKLIDTGSLEEMKELLSLLISEYMYDLEKFEESNEKCHLHSLKSCQPTTEIYNIILRGIAIMATDDPNVAYDAEELLIEMIENHSIRKWPTKPDGDSFTSVANAYANAGTPDSSSRALFLLDRMKEYHEDEKKEYEAKFGKPYNLEDPSKNDIQIFTPDALLYTSILRAIVNSKSRGSASQAAMLLQKIVNERVSDVDSICFNVVLSGFAAEISQERSIESRFKLALEAEGLARTLLKRHKEFSPCLGSECMNSEEIESTWSSQLTLTFNTVINVWVKSNLPEAGAYAEQLYDDMSKSIVMQPDFITMKTLLEAYSRSFNALKAEAMLRKVLRYSEENQVEASEMPDARTYTSLITAWSRYSSADKTFRARSLLETMITKYIAGDLRMKPNVVAFTSVLNAAANSKFFEFHNAGVTNKSFQIALITYDEMIFDAYSLSLQLDTFVFSVMLKVVESYTERTSEDRQKLLKNVFDDACEHGHVSSLVIQRLQSASPDIEFLAKLLNSRELAENISSIHDLPKAWTRGVPNQPRLTDIQTVFKTRTKGNDDPRNVSK
jgi:hypothetical protein